MKSIKKCVSVVYKEVDWLFETETDQKIFNSRSRIPDTREIVAGAEGPRHGHGLRNPWIVRLLACTWLTISDSEAQVLKMWSNEAASHEQDNHHAVNDWNKIFYAYLFSSIALIIII